MKEGVKKKKNYLGLFHFVGKEGGGGVYIFTTAPFICDITPI